MRNATKFFKAMPSLKLLLVASLAVSYGCEDPAAARIKKPRQPISGKKSEDGSKSPPKSKRECLALVGGAPSKDEPQTALLVGNLRANNYTICTGTWVSDSTMITASHCLEDTEKGGMYFIPGAGEIVTAADLDTLVKRGVQPLKAIIGAPEFTIDRFDQTAFANGMYRDIAVLVFPPRTAPAYVPVSEAAIAPQEKLTLVGYGAISVFATLQGNQANEIDIRRRLGSNFIIPEPKLNDPGFQELQGYLRFNLYNVRGAAVSDGQTYTAATVIGQGDAGGPLLSGAALAGIAVAGAEIPRRFRGVLGGSNAIWHFAPLQSTFAIDVLTAAEASGAKIHRVKDPREAKIQIVDPNPPVVEPAPNPEQPGDMPLDDGVQEPRQELESIRDDLACEEE